MSDKTTKNVGTDSVSGSALNGLLSDFSTSATSSDSPPFNKEAMLDAIKLLAPPPENPFQTLAKKNGFDLDKGDNMFIHPLDIPHEAFACLHKNLVPSKHIERGNIYFAKAGFHYGR